MKIYLLFLLMFLFNFSVKADTVHLKSGKTVEGKIIKETDDYIKIETMGFPITYFKDTIKEIIKEEKPKESKESDLTILEDEGPEQKNFFMETYNDDILSAQVPAIWKRIDSFLFPFESYSDRVMRIISHKAAYDPGFLALGEKERPKKPMSYSQISQYLIEKIGSEYFYKLPAVVYLNGERVINFTLKRNYDKKEIYVNTDIFFRGKKWRVLEIAFESKNYLAYRDALKKMRNNVELR